MALTDQTRAQLRRRVADKFGDLITTVATGNGIATTWVDTVNVNSGSESYDGREILFTSGANLGLVSRITGTNVNGTLTFTPQRTSTSAADAAEIFNRRGRGFLVNEYHRAINEAIEELNGMSLIPTIEAISGTYSADTQTIAVPATTREVFKVEFEDTDDIWKEVKPSHRHGNDGWTPESSAGVIRIEGGPAWQADGHAVRLHGYKEQIPLVDDTSVCSFDGNAVVLRAAYRLCMAALDRDGVYGSMVLTLARESDMALSRARVLRAPGTRTVRI